QSAGAAGEADVGQVAAHQRRDVHVVVRDGPRRHRGGVGNDLRQRGAGVRQPDAEDVLSVPVDAAAGQVNGLVGEVWRQAVCTDGGRATVGEDPRGIDTFAGVVVDVELDGHAVADPGRVGVIVGMVLTVAEAATPGPQRPGAACVALNDKGHTIG